MKIFLINCFISISWTLFGQVEKPGLLWEITHPQREGKSYLFGTFHSNSPQLMQLQDSTWCAFLKTQNIIFEVDIQSELANRFSYFDAAVYNQSALNKNVATSGSTAYGDEDGWPQFMDMMLYEKAQLMDKTISFLESIDDQLSVMNGYDLLSTEIDDKQFTNAYTTGNIIKIQKMMQENTSESFYDRLIINRNTTMAQRLDSMLRIETLFCAIGAGHLAGQEGVIMKLRSKGYTVRKVGLGDKKCIFEQRKIRNFSQILPEEVGSQVFPGVPIKQDEDGIITYSYCEFGQGNIYQLELIPLKEGISYPDLIADMKSRAVSVGTIENQQFNGVEGIEAMSKSEDGALIWQRLLNLGEFAVILSCHGGEKFMRSNRPKMYFDNFKKNK